MLILKFYLLSGLIAHKLIWELLKLRLEPGASRAASPGLLVVKAVKIAILAGIAIQTLLPDVLPIREETTPIRVVGVAVYTAGLLIALAGRLQLGSNWSDIETGQVLRHQSVVADGLYRFIRHPIYVGDLMLLAGLEMALNSWLVLGVAALAPVVLWKAVREERLLVESLPGYLDYCARTKRFIPFLV